MERINFDPVNSVAFDNFTPQPVKDLTKFSTILIVSLVALTAIGIIVYNHMNREEKISSN